MGNKAAARARMESAGVPVVPGSKGTVADAEEAALQAKKIGYPVLLKASAGGGGRGMRRVYGPDELAQSFARRQSELITLNRKLEERAAELTHLVEQAEAISRSPQFLRELILTGHSKGRTADQLAKATGLSRDEVELILAQTSKEGTARR